LAGRAGLVLLSVACLAVAVLAPLEIRMIAAGLSPVLPATAVTAALKSPWVLQPVFAGFSILSPSWLWVVMPALLAAVALFAWLASGRRLLRVRRVPAWRSATVGVSGRASYTAFGFANPTRRVLAAVLHTKAEVTRFDKSVAGPSVVPDTAVDDTAVDDTGVAGTGVAGTVAPGTATADAARDGAAAAVAHVGFSSDVIEVVEEYLYLPLQPPFRLLVRAAQRLQSGRLDAYLGYMLIALVAVLAVVTGLH
jgi:hydrogenase-4 component B